MNEPRQSIIDVIFKLFPIRTIKWASFELILDIYILFISNNFQMIILPFIPILALLIQTSYSLYDILQSRNEVNEIEVQVLLINSKRKLIPKDFEGISWLIIEDKKLFVYSIRWLLIIWEKFICYFPQYWLIML